MKDTVKKVEGGDSCTFFSKFGCVYNLLPSVAAFENNS